uniref:Large ribosomal subunit protein uL4 n=1 Tax=uncultured Chloroflexi bacterium Rifle_16ft_4_minimus_15241 TaxID=1665060 RepID=A0A0H4T0Y3_9CHLR|nr:50S ribosomal protein L4, large subunit ribosomal protein L4 [uncultured Chloroflexi bacterium Rifle_16ft_4_minimus_15241]
MEVDVVNMQGKKVKRVTLPAAIFEAPVRQDLMHQALVRQLANARLGTVKTKGRGEGSGGGRKPWRQKGTGRARQGSTRAPQWRGGGKVHTPVPRDYSVSMPVKMRRAALRSALSAKAAEAMLVVVDELTLETPSTSAMAVALKAMTGGENALVLLPQGDEVVERSVRNLAHAKTLRANYLNIRDLFAFQKVVVPLAALDLIGAWLDPGRGA